jgi:hypothetical protein
MAMEARTRTPLDYYEILGVTRRASDAEIKRGYRRAATQAHPDAGGSTDRFMLVREAYDVLSDPVRRRLYDHAGRKRPAERPKPADPALGKLAAAQSAYLYYAERYRQAPRALWDAVPPPGPTWSDYPAINGARARACRAFVRELTDYEWPVAAIDAVRRLVHAVAFEAGIAYESSLLPGTESSQAEPSRRLVEAEDIVVVATDAMRRALDL